MIATSGSKILSNSQMGPDVVKTGNIKDGEIVNADIAANAAIAFSKLAGAAAAGANSDITSLSGLTTPLSIAQGGTGGTIKDVQDFTSNGTWTKPANAKLVVITLIGQGGGGFGTKAADGSAGGGGGGGAIETLVLNADKVPATVSVTVSSADNSGFNGDGIDGINTVFGSILTAIAGKKGVWNGAGGAGGTTSVGVAGGAGAASVTDQGGGGGGAGGSGASGGTHGNAGTTSPSLGNGGDGKPVDTAGQDGVNYGGGGGGAGGGAGTSRHGGIGGAGIAHIVTYC